MKRIALLAIILIGALFLSGCAKIVKNSNSNNAGSNITQNSNEPVVKNNESISNANFFDDSSPVMFFYSDSCGWCQKQKEVLNELSPEGYRVKSMDVGKNQDYWEKYKIDGTPTFIAANGEKSVGYKDKAAMKSWLDSHGAKIK